MKNFTIVFLLFPCLYSFAQVSEISYYDGLTGQTRCLNYKSEPPIDSLHKGFNYAFCDKSGKIILDNRNPIFSNVDRSAENWIFIPHTDDSNKIYFFYQITYSGFPLNGKHFIKFSLIDLAASGGNAAFIFQDSIVGEFENFKPHLQNFKIVPDLSSQGKAWWLLAFTNDSIVPIRFINGMFEFKQKYYPEFLAKSPNYWVTSRNLFFSNSYQKLIACYYITSAPNPSAADIRHYTICLDFNHITGELLYEKFIDSLAANNYNGLDFSPNDSFCIAIKRTNTSLESTIYAYPVYDSLPFQKRQLLAKPSNNQSLYYCRITPNGNLIIGDGYQSNFVLYKPEKVLAGGKLVLQPFKNYLYSLSRNDFSKKYYLKFNAFVDCKAIAFGNPSDTSVFKEFWWFFHDYKAGTVDSINAFEPRYLLKSNYSDIYVRLRGKTPDGYVQWYSDTIENIKPLAMYTTQCQTGCQWVAYTFTSSSRADTTATGIVTHHWNFGDGTDTAVYSSLSNINYNISHIYKQTGTYTITLIVHNGFCADTLVRTASVTILSAPKPGFTLSTKSYCGLPNTVTLTAATSTGVQLYSYLLGNSDSISTNNATTTYTYTQAGNYTIVQQLLSPTGCITSDTLRIRISPGLKPTDKPLIAYTTVTGISTTLTTWQPLPIAKSYLVNNNFTTTDTFFTLTNVRPSEQSVPVFVEGVDSCGNQSGISLISTTILLKGENVDENRYALLNYTPYENWAGGVSRYIIESRTEDNQWKTIATLNPSSLSYNHPSFADSIEKQTPLYGRCYRVKAEAANGATSSLSNEACVPYAPAVFIPTAFSPNGDGINDTFEPVLLGMKEYFLWVYSRQGQLIYYTDHQQPKGGWDGTLRGEALPAGQYLWVFKGLSGIKSSQYHNPASNIEKQGLLTLLR